MKQKNRLNRMHVFMVTTILLIIIIIALLYIFQGTFRNWVDIHILRKDITEEDIIAIDLDTGKANQVYVYNKYIAILNNQVMTLYNNYGEEIKKIDVNINKALFDSNEKYLAIAEDGGGEIYLILDKTYLWSNKIEGKILQIKVNRNGYIAVVTQDSTYKSILTLYNSDGKKLFTSYYAETRVIDVSISEDNKYVAIGEIDSSGALIKSNVKILSIEDAKDADKDACIYTYNEKSGKLLTNIKYQSKGKLICMYDDSIHVIKDKEITEIFNIRDKEITFMSVNLENSAVYVQEEKTGVFRTNSHINIINTQNNQINTYNLEDVPKSLHTKDEVIGVNIGNEIHFLNTNGWLIKKYSTKQEITNVIFSDNLAGIIYKDKVIVVDL